MPDPVDRQQQQHERYNAAAAMQGCPHQSFVKQGNIGDIGGILEVGREKTQPEKKCFQRNLCEHNVWIPIQPCQG